MLEVIKKNTIIIDISMKWLLAEVKILLNTQL
jgi:hypothetical protein